MSVSSHVIGTKYQMFIEDELVVLRLINIKDDGKKFILLDKDKTKVSMTTEQINNCVKLAPDALINIMITHEDEFDVDDVYVCVNPLNVNRSEPSLILRQNVLSPLNELLNTNGDPAVYIGGCFVDRNYIGSKTIAEYLQFSKITNKWSISSYLDDSVEDIFDCIGLSKITKINNTLNSIKSNLDKQSNAFMKFRGAQNNLSDLLESLSFMYWYRSLFNINQVEFPIELENNVDKDGNINLTKKQQTAIEDLLRKKISIISVLKYDRDIDISAIVSLKHIMICDSENRIYLIAYDIIDDYPVDEDIARAMGLQK